jgi:hypothetical protein
MGVKEGAGTNEELGEVGTRMGGIWSRIKGVREARDVKNAKWKDEGDGQGKT